MMHENGNYLYYQTRDFQLVSLPYEGQRYSMDILLPRPGLGRRSLKFFGPLLALWSLPLSWFDLPFDADKPPATSWPGRVG